MRSKYIYRCVAALICVFAFLPFLFPSASAASTLTLFDGGLTITDSVGTGSGNASKVTITAKGSTLYRQQNDITITNTTDVAMNLSFDYTISNADTIDFPSGSSNSSGTVSVTLIAGGTVTGYIIAKRFNQTVTMTLSNFSYEAAPTDLELTIGYDSTLGSVTADGTTVTDNGTVTVNPANGVTLDAVPNSGVTFLGWVDTNDNNKIKSKEDPYAASLGTNASYRAIFAKNNGAPVFGVGSLVDGKVKVEYLFEGFAAAHTFASGAGPDYMVLMNNATLPAGDYTIASGVTLLIPYNADNTLCTTTPNVTTGSTKPSAYRTMTMADGANITVYGGLSIAGTQSASQRYNGSPVGPVGVINMKDGSSITVESNGYLYAWGYIYNQVKDSTQAMVTIKSGGNVYEDFQVRDWRGGSYTNDMKDNEYRVLPFSQYYVQNIQVPLKIESGAVETCVMSVDITLLGVQTSDVPFIAKNIDCMFKLTSGYIIKDYQESTDRLIVSSYGDLNIAPYSIEVQASVIAKVKMDTANYALPINGNLTLNVESGTVNLSQDLAMLPGAKIKVAEGAKCNLLDGAKMYIYDLDVWNQGFCGHEAKQMLGVYYAYDNTANIRTALTGDASVEVNGTVDASEGYLYTTSSGANVYSTGTGKIIARLGNEEYTYQVVQSGDFNDRNDGKDYEDIVPIPITPAVLQNGDTSYLHTSANTAVTTYTYCADCQKWQTIVSYYASNVELGNNLNLYFAFMRDEITDSSGHYVKINGGNAIYYDDWQGYDSNDDEVDDYFVVIYEGLAAKQMCDAVSVTLYDKDGNMIDAWCDSIRNYAMRLLASADETYTLLDANNDGEVDNPDNQTTFTGILNLRKLLVDMLNYGAACQTYFGYNTSDLANSQLTDAQKTYASTEVDWTDDSQMPSGSTNYPANLVTKSNIRFAIANVTGGTYSFNDHWGDKQEGSLVLQAADGTDAAYYYIDKLTVADARQVITITAGSTSWNDSIEAYCKRMIDDKAAEAYVYEAFMKFSDSAKAYLEGEGRLK